MFHGNGVLDKAIDLLDDENKKEGLNAVQNQIMAFMQGNDGITKPYKYVCDVFLKPAMRDTKSNSSIDVTGTKDIEFLKIISDFYEMFLFVSCINRKQM